MADSAFLSRLPVKGAVFQSAGSEDAFKVPLLDSEGKIDLTLISSSSKIYDAANTAARLTLTAATPGDYCVQADNTSIYFLKQSPPTIENNWIRLSTVQDAEQDFDSPNFTGVPTAPTAPNSTNSTQLATTAFVKNLAATEIPIADSQNGSIGSSIKFAKGDHSHPQDITRAPLNNPQFTGLATGPTPDYTDNNTRLATTSYVKQQSIDGFTLPRTNVHLNNFRITSLGTPINERDAATKAYVDALQSGLTVREAVKAATTATQGNISLTGAVTEIDGVVVNNGDRVLVKNQTNAAQNGIYIVNLGSQWQRSADADSSLEMKNGVYAFVLDGVVNKNSAWVLVTSANVTLNTTPLNFIYFTNQDANLILAGYGIKKETNTLLVDDAVIATVQLVATKQDTLVSGTNIKTLNNEALLGSGDIVLTKESIELNNVDNTSDANKPVSTDQQAALDLKANQAALDGHTGDINNPHQVTKSQIGLSNADNTSDANKPVSTAQQTALDLKANASDLTAHIGNTNNPHGVTKSQVGLGNVDNTSDTNKPVSTAQAAADTAVANAASADATSKANAALASANTYTDGAVANLIDSAPGALDTLDELAAALGDDSNFAGTVTNSLALKAPLANPTFTGTVSGVTKSMVGLGNTDNTSDANKPVSTATQTALNLKANLVSPTFTGTVGGITKTMVGLGNVDNTSDANKPVSTAQQTALNLKANQSALDNHTGNTSNPHTVTKSQIGLGNADNTSDANKPVSSAQQTALNTKQNTLSVSANQGLALSSDNLSTVYNTTIADAVQSIAVGGAQATAASNWKTKTIVQVLDDILFPDVLPTYTIPTITLSGTQSGTKEIGEVISQSLTVSGTKNDAGAFNSFSIARGGVATGSVGSTSSPTTSTTANIPDQFGYVNPNNPNTIYSYQVTDSFTVLSGQATWTGSSSYSAGQAKKNNKGVTDTRAAQVRSTTAPQAAGTNFQSTASSVTGIYPYYWGISNTQPTKASIATAIQTGEGAIRELSSSSGTVTVTYNANGQFIWFAHANTYTAKTKWYNTELNQGNIGAGNFILAPEDQNMAAQNGRWTAVPFKVYISAGATTTSGSIQFRNS